MATTNYLETIYIQSDDRAAVVAGLKEVVWERLPDPASVQRTQSYLHLSQPLNGWMQLYYRRPDVTAPFVVMADRVLYFTWRALNHPGPAVRVFEDDGGSFSYFFSIGGLEFASLEKPAMRRASVLVQAKEIDEELQKQPYVSKVVKLIDTYNVMEKAIVENQSKIGLSSWNTKKMGNPPKEVVNIDKSFLFKSFGEWVGLDFEAARREIAQKRNPKEKNRKTLEQQGRESEKLMQVPYYWEPDPDEE